MAAAVSDAQTSRLRQEVLRYLQSHTTMTIASARRGVPWASPVFYANDEFALCFYSQPHSRHGVNMAAHAVVSAAIYGDYHDWRSIRGIQLEGRVELVQSKKLRERLAAIFREKFPFVDELLPRRAAAKARATPKLSGIKLYLLTPSCVWYLDNSLGFGHRQQLELRSLAHPSLAGAKR
jgi:uncharacterized protein YhbP (UPF0306 family)